MSAAPARMVVTDAQAAGASGWTLTAVPVVSSEADLRPLEGIHVPVQARKEVVSAGSGRANLAIRTPGTPECRRRAREPPRSFFRAGCRAAGASWPEARSRPPAPATGMRKAEPPVEDEQHHGHRSAVDAPVPNSWRHRVAEQALLVGGVLHDRARQIGQVALAEEGEGENRAAARPIADRACARFPGRPTP